MEEEEGRVAERQRAQQQWVKEREGGREGRGGRGS